eukprot:TRINITY_DN3622_c0_g1_i3.p1 TRINITY_DN3622_c0_g1~~TRINITY_DN3622_c0_g1_i3.p1  ORF type:complete len:293 (+),score=66.44 TRINITY_DN3622_c0_g1_i3:65-880(+)
MGQACARRASAPADAKTNRTASATTATAAKSSTSAPPKTETLKHDPKKYSNDYSRFADIVDSDEEKEKEEAAKNAADEDEEETAIQALGWDGSNPSAAERLQMCNDMMELCRNTFKETRSKLGASGPDTSVTKALKLPKDHKKKFDGVISVDELAKYSCSSDRMLVSCLGDVYDVSSRPDQYGYGAKSFQAGKDITWCVVTGKETPKNCNRFYDIFKLDTDHLSRYLQIVCGRLVSLEEEFGEPVGRLDKFAKERTLPPPPTDEVEECKQQ